MKLYGSLCNRLEEGVNYTGREIKEGDDITMYWYSDRRCYYVTKVVDQKHIFVKKYEVVADREKEGGMGHQNWLYFKTKKECNEYLKKYGRDDKEFKENEEHEWVFKWGKWREKTINEWTNKEELRELEPISFGVREYYYDWEF